MAHSQIYEVHSQFAGLADMINIFANAPFTLLPILIGFSAAKSLNLDVLKSYRVQPLKTDCPQTF
jgi:phosphotransferase system  glucose/maltose/N-acetylglucosamine-specific IIC component